MPLGPLLIRMANVSDAVENTACKRASYDAYNGKTVCDVAKGSDDVGAKRG